MPNTNSQLRRRVGFTLIEVLIAIVIIGITMLAIGMVMRTSVRSWQLGHAVAETTQSTRVTEDVILRDLSNIFYLKESDYNRSFRRSLDEFGSLLEEGEMVDPTRDLGTYRRRKRDRDRKQDEEQAAEDIADVMDSRRLTEITPPINLTFNGSDGAKTDTISFTRRHDPRWVEEPATWGLRRVTYSVKDKVLYRNEEDPFGSAPQSSGGYGTLPAMRQLLQLFERPEADKPNALGVSMLPEAIAIDEPLCEGVEVFDVTYGYFESDVWHEVTNWQSNSSQYRGLPGMDSPEFDEMTAGMSMSELNSVTPMFMSMANQPRIQDDLPAYAAIQIGIRLKGGKGKLYSYTFYHSFPQAQETDQRIVMPDGRELRSSSKKDERSRRRRDGKRS